MALYSVISLAGIWDELPMKEKWATSCMTSCSSAHRERRILQWGLGKGLACAVQIKRPVVFRSKELTLTFCWWIDVAHETTWVTHWETQCERVWIQAGWTILREGEELMESRVQFTRLPERYVWVLSMNLSVIYNRCSNNAGSNFSMKGAVAVVA